MKNFKTFTGKDNPSKDVVKFMNTLSDLEKNLKSSISFEKTYAISCINLRDACQSRGNGTYFTADIWGIETIPFNKLDKFVNESKELIDKIEKANEKMNQIYVALSEDDKQYIIDVYGKGR